MACLAGNAARVRQLAFRLQRGHRARLIHTASTDHGKIRMTCADRQVRLGILPRAVTPSTVMPTVILGVCWRPGPDARCRDCRMDFVTHAARAGLIRSFFPTIFHVRIGTSQVMICAEYTAHAGMASQAER